MDMDGEWQVRDTGVASAERNMEIDAELLEAQSVRQDNRAILHLYDWSKPCATYGYFTDPLKLLSQSGIEATSLDLAKRPTGGGVIFHVTDFAFSMIIPASHPGYSVNVLDNYAFVNALVMEVIQAFSGKSLDLELLPQEPQKAGAHARHFCMAKPTKYDVMFCGRKLGGGAQRRTRHGFLHQGSISLAFPNEAFLKQVLKADTEVFDSMRLNTFALLPGEPSPHEIREARQSLKEIFTSLLLTKR